MKIEPIKREDAFPIGKHLQINFEECKTDEFISKIIEYLEDKDFDSKKSRTLVFVRSRKKAEQWKIDFNNYQEDWKADFFHAGISADDRQRIYEAYKSGETSVLFATKAFGMGMNIPNIHFLFHLQPSSSFEDFLQEVGRAGRKKEDYEAVGFSEKQPIQTICFYDKEDFGTVKGLIEKSILTWDDLVKAQTIITDYCKRFIPSVLPTEKAVAVNANLFRQNADFNNNGDINTHFRMYLYWLEKANKVKLGYYVVSHCIFDNQSFKDKTEEIVDDKQRQLVEYLKNRRDNDFKGQEQSSIELNPLKKELNCSQSDLYKLLIKAHKDKDLKWLLLKNLKVTERTIKRKGNIEKKSIYLPSVEYFFKAANTILEEIPPKDKRLNLSGEEFDNLINNINIGYAFGIDKMPWLKDKKDIKEAVEKAIQDVREKRIKRHIWWFISTVPNIKQRSIIDIDTGKINYNITAEKYIDFSWVKRFKDDLLKLLQHIYNQNIKQGKEVFDIPTLAGLSYLQENSIDYLSSLLVGLKKLGFIRYSGGLMPISIECYLQDDEPLDDKKNLKDEALKSNFETVQNLKTLRLVVLQAFSKIKDRTIQEEYIKDYFKCKNEQDIISLFTQYPKYIDNEIIEQYQGKALKKRVEGDEDDKIYGLNEKQKEVYNAPFDKHLSVIAGPGSGKTHTLVLRIARLIHEKKVAPADILVLAFNRSVVLELKERIRELFYELGYSNFTRSLKVFTFHGLVKYCLREEVKDIEPKHWISFFNEKLRDEKGLIKNRLGIIKYIFIDEFQDINNERLAQIDFLAGLNNAKITAIGDPNQSIYGFERVKDGALAPRPYYHEFHKKYRLNKKENYLFLDINYRSYTEIIETAANILTYQNGEQSKILPLVCKNSKNHNSVESYNLTKPNYDWKERLQELFRENYSEKDDNKKKHNEIAIMVRTNEEIYMAYKQLKKINIPSDFEIRIQGESNDIFKSREFRPFIIYMEGRINDPLPDDFISTFKNNKGAVIKKYPKWYNFHLDILHALHYEFDKMKEDNATYQDLYDFIKDFTQKDDGQLYQLYERTKIKLGFKNIKRIILTTIHRVKGLEFETVIVLPSYAVLPFKPENGILTSDYIDEELRLLYVAYSRAKEKLIIYKGERESALVEHKAYTPTLSGERRYPVKSDIEKFIIFTLASEEIQTFLNQIKMGSEVYLHKSKKSGKWQVIINDKRVGTLSPDKLQERKELQIVKNNRLRGFYLSGFIKYTYQEVCEYDREHRTTFRNSWDDYCKNRGWILIPDFAGYGEPY